MRRRSCVSFLSPSSSPLMCCWSLRCSEAAVHLMSSAFSLSYGFSVGGRRSRTSVAKSEERLLTT